MTRINFDLPISDYLELKEIIGERNMSKTFRELAQQMIQQDNKSELEKRAKELEKQISDLNERKIIIDLKLKHILQKEEDEITKESSVDPFSHLNGKTKLNEAQICLYRIEKGTLPEWAKKEPNPKEYAIKIINNVIKKTKGEKHD